MTIAERFGLPVMMLGGVSYAMIKLFQWMANSLMKQIAENHQRIESIIIKLIDSSRNRDEQNNLFFEKLVTMMDTSNTMMAKLYKDTKNGFNNDKGARSYKGQIVGDNMSIQINFKWLLQIIAATGMVVYGWYQLETRIQALERNMVLALEEIELHDKERKVAEEKHKTDMEEELSLLKTELNINPFSWGKKKK